MLSNTSNVYVLCMELLVANVAFVRNSNNSLWLTASHLWNLIRIMWLPFYQDNRVTDHRLKMNFELTSFLECDIEDAVRACASMEQKELLEELAESVAATAG
ncbi:hypothetical protein F3Y22_tig00111594pilonHSYRG00064 [Hibiscus syriacus]|uniref:Uncharacterized protein n=1 Tax=Hibiscus syriacus TaxID=106335 RepID=A0A6A2YGQ4_HIBSY|nr:hypothetical protein F3Y22_tig00111594pilonHSYRG00064 [Hibiscus syriacus]